MPEARFDRTLVLILIAGALLRLFIAIQTPAFPDEKEGYIPLAQSISILNPVNLPLRGRNHPALVGYVVKASGVLFGETLFGYRVLHLLLGVGTIALVYGVARQWYGLVAARWAAALLAFNDYHIGVSGIATSHAPQLFLVCLSIWAFARFLKSTDPRYLYAGAVATAVAFYCKEHSAIMLIVVAVVLMDRSLRGWFRSIHLYLALGLFLLLIAPDVYWNVSVADTTQATYSDHLSRIGGLGLSWYPWAFYARDVVRWLYERTTGPFSDAISEYTAMNVVAGVTLLAGLVLSVFYTARNILRRFLLTHFCLLFGFFALITRPNTVAKNLDRVSWSWVDGTLFACVILTAAVLASSNGRVRAVLRPIAFCAMAIGAVRTFM